MTLVVKPRIKEIQKEVLAHSAVPTEPSSRISGNRLVFHLRSRLRTLSQLPLAHIFGRKSQKCLHALTEGGCGLALSYEEIVCGVRLAPIRDALVTVQMGKLT